MAQNRMPIANLKGPKGDTGPQGAPGVDAIPAQSAVADYLASAASPVNAAAKALINQEGRKQFAGIGSVGNSPAPVAWGASTIVLTKAEMIAGTGLNSIYWPSVVDARGIPGAPGNFLMFWSTDHDPGAGGIGMAYASTPSGPWTIQGKVYADTSAGTQTETPTVVRDGDNLVMYYQQSGVGVGAQSTLYATSTNGISWVRQGIALEKPRTSLPGDGHTGYAKVYKMGRALWLAYSLYGGTDYPRWAIWYSADGKSWCLDRDAWVNSIDYTDRNDLMLTANPTLFYWGGEMWAHVSMKTKASGTSSPSESYPYAVRVAADGRFTGEWVETAWFPNSVVTFESRVYGYQSAADGIHMRELN